LLVERLLISCFFLCSVVCFVSLGKTVQTVAHLRTLFQAGLRGPFLILSPLSCTPHWAREFEAWVPEMHVVSYAGKQEARDVAQEYELGWLSAMGDLTDSKLLDKARNLENNNRKRLRQLRAHVVIASYDTMRNATDFFRSVEWQAIVVDEAHQIRNEQSKLYQCIQECDIDYKVRWTNHLIVRMSPAPRGGYC